MEFKKYINMLLENLLTNGIQLILLIVLTIISLNLVNFFIDKLFTGIIKINANAELEKRTQTLQHLAKSISSILIISVAIVIALSMLGIDIGPILAAAGVLGVAIGFGAQRFIEDIISGFIILLEDQVRVGDVVKIGDRGGLVEKVDLKMVVLRDLSGNVHYIRNGKIDIITNMTKDYSRYVFEIGVAYKENIDEVIEIVKLVDEEIRNDDNFKNDILEPIEILGLDRFADSALIIKARTKTKPIRQWAVGREFNKRLKIKFDELGIEIPFPHRTIYIGQDKKGESAPLNIKKHD